MKNEFGKYKMVLEVIESYEDEDILGDFKERFEEGKDISKEDYLDFCENYIDDISEKRYIYRNWRYIVE
jgi:hypothetical protein